MDHASRLALELESCVTEEDLEEIGDRIAGLLPEGDLGQWHRTPREASVRAYKRLVEAWGVRKRELQRRDMA